MRCLNPVVYCLVEFYTGHEVAMVTVLMPHLGNSCLAMGCIQQYVLGNFHLYSRRGVMKQMPYEPGSGRSTAPGAPDIKFHYERLASDPCSA